VGVFATKVIINNVIAPQVNLAYMPERFSGLCGEGIGGNRVVIFDADGKLYYANQSDPTHANKIAGVTLQAGIADSVITCQSSGQMDEAGWTWDVSKPVYLADNGLMTQVLPTSGFIIVIGMPITATSLLIRIHMPIMVN
jgi:hypothetical protein